jgi:hypothetical protein
MTRALPAALAAFAVLLSSLPAQAERGNGRGQGNDDCPPGLARRDPACVPPGQARGDRDDDEEIWLAERDDDHRNDEALAIVGALMGLALLERAAREERDEEPSVSPAPEPPSDDPLFLVPRAPERPDFIEELAFEEPSDAAVDDTPADPAPAPEPVAAEVPAAPPPEMLTPAPVAEELSPVLPPSDGPAPPTTLSVIGTLDSSALRDGSGF